MKRRRLGRTGFLVSEISLGTVQLGLDYGIGAPPKPSEQDAAALLHAALDLGVNLIDTARAYGTSEPVIGRALRGRRHEFVLVSKVQPKPGNPSEVRRLVETSLRELQTDCIDVMMLHCGTELLPDPESTEVLERMREAGNLRFVGASVYGPESACTAIRTGRYDCLEVGYSLLDRRPEADVFPLAVAHDVGILARSVLLKGALTGRCSLLPDALGELKAAVAACAEVAGGLDALPAVAYRYVLSRTPPHSALVGTSTLAELRTAIGYAEQGPLPEHSLEPLRAMPAVNSLWLNPGNWPQ
ncbi:MAG: aldo/keto reductase [Acidobacteria bacterium]|nr:aldo/keto reductase [Acidobacteriota bacterium]